MTSFAFNSLLNWTLRSRTLAALSAATALAAASSSPGHALPPRAATAGADAPLATKIAVFGADNRTKLPKRLESLKGSVGVIYNERTRTVCSAFCVADDVIGTASHCLYRTKGETAPPPERFFFARPGTRYQSVRFAGAASKSSAQHIVTGTVGISTKPPIEAARDWAFVKLQGPACRGNVLPVEPMTPGDIEVEAKANRLYQAAFHRDYGKWTLAYSEPCAGGGRIEGNPAQVTERDFADPLNLVLHLCDTGGASSGSPLLVERPAGPVVVAINVGTFVQSRVMIQGGEVISRTTAAPVANTAVSSSAFVGRYDALRSASILTSSADLKELQRKLDAAAFYDGPTDGRYDSRLRAAIESFERKEGLTVSGLPTRGLLELLSRPPPPRLDRIMFSPGRP